MAELAQMNKDLIYLSNKRTLLANPGTKMDGIYYSALNTTVELAEATYNVGRLTISLSQTNFRSQSQIVIPNSSLLEEIYLHLELPDLVSDQTVCRAWGYGIIDSISYLFGSSNVSQIAINGQTLLQKIMLQCETEEKRSEMYNLGGEVQLAPTGGPITADVLLPLPWSSASGLFDKLPFDTGLLANPITIQIQFRGADAIYGGNGVRPAGFNQATCTIRQGDLTNKDQSLKFELMKSPDLMYAYPFIHTQSYIPSSVNSGIAGRITLPLLSFINADLVGISLGVVRADRYRPTGNNSPSPFRYDKLQNINLTFNGLQMYNALGQSYKLYNLKGRLGSSDFKNDVIAAGAVAPFTSSPVDSYILAIDFSRIPALTYEGKYQNVWRIGNNTLTIEFDVEDVSQDYLIFASYHYNGVAEVQNGETRIYFD